MIRTNCSAWLKTSWEAEIAALTLSRLLNKKGPLASILDGLDNGVSILEVNGRVVWGPDEPTGGERAAILVEGQPFGWVCGGRSPAALASLLAYAASQEAEKKSLASEVLDRYRELNLLYHLSESLGASPRPESIAAAALTAALRIIPAETGQIVLKAGPAGEGQTLAASGRPYLLAPGCLLVERVLASGRAELTSSAPGEEIFVEAAGQIISGVCAPLKTEKNTLGIILLASQDGRNFTAGDLKLLNSIAQQAAPIIEVSRLYQIEIEKTRLESELQMARKVQESLLPEKLPAIPGWQFAQRWRPVRNVSGDFYDVIPEGPQRLGLVTADVTDKGLPASLFMVFVRSVLRASITRRAAPAQVLTNTNRVMCQDSYQGLFATLFYARLETSSGELTYVNAGHPPGLLYRRNEDCLQLLARTGMPLGVDLGAAYTSETVWLEDEDFLLLYTDGMIEAENQAGEEFGLEKLIAEAFKLRRLPPAALLDGLEQALAVYTQPLPVQDDLTLLLVRRG